MITIKIPTKKQELKELLLKIKYPQRYRHNTEILNKMYNEICTEITSSYWNNDMSDYMRANIVRKIKEIILKYKKDLI